MMPTAHISNNNCAVVDRDRDTGPFVVRSGNQYLARTLKRTFRWTLHENEACRFQYIDQAATEACIQRALGRSDVRTEPVNKQ